LKRFLDSGVLLTAWRGQAPLGLVARTLLDQAAEFLSSENVRLELLPKPLYERRRTEIDFYNQYFSLLSYIEPFSGQLGEAAMSLAKRYGLSGGDALNVASAVRQSADEFLTSEAPGKLSL
jgi:predicted nucleic acid-binding protein